MNHVEPDQTKLGERACLRRSHTAFPVFARAGDRVYGWSRNLPECEPVELGESPDRRSPDCRQVSVPGNLSMNPDRNRGMSPARNSPDDVPGSLPVNTAGSSADSLPETLVHSLQRESAGEPGSESSTQSARE